MKLGSKPWPVLGLAAALSVSGAAAQPVGPGDPASEFTLADTEAASHSLSAYRGRLVLLWFFGYG
jgi:hypothetical protein